MNQIRRKWTIILVTVTLALTSFVGVNVQRPAAAAGQSDPNEFIKGVDISTLQALEDKGIKFYDGGGQKDLLVILKEHGVNYVRLRVWNNPIEAEGYNDKAHTVAMAQRVKAAGMKLLVDFHYSDFWADPGKQVKPAAWAGLDFAGLKQAVYDYTAEVMNDLKAVNAYPDMVQIGNEINNGMIHPEGSASRFDNLAELLKQGVKAVRDTTPQGHTTKIMLHLAEGGSNDKFRSFFDNVTQRGVDYDIIGLSYYPYWHGTFQQLKTNMNDMAARYGKQIVVAETAYPFTYENGDDLGNIAGEVETKVAGFPASAANQKLVTQTVMNTVYHVNDGKGLGIFYWEPAWLPGVGWKLGEGNGWENQAMFDYQGRALDSLQVFQYTPGSITETAPIMVYASQSITTVRGETPPLPDKADVLYNEGTVSPADVTWDSIPSEQLNTPGKFTVQGTVAGLNQKASIEITVLENPNLVSNPGYESGDLTGWTMTGTTTAGKIDESAGNAHSGSHSFNYHHNTDYSYKLSQTITGLKNGTYRLKAWASGGGGETKLKLFAENYGGAALTTDAVNTGWNVWKPYTVDNIQVTNGQVTIGFDVEAPGEVWGFFDDFELIEAPPVNQVKNPGFENGDLTDWTLTGTTDAGKVENNAGNSYAGSHAFNYWYGTPYAYQLTQTINGLENGTYALKAWASGGGGETKLKLFAETMDGAAKAMLSTDIVNTGWNVWNAYTVENIKVTDGQMTIGFDVEAPGDVWGYFDQVELMLVEAAPAEPAPSEPAPSNPDPVQSPDRKDTNQTVTVGPEQLKHNQAGKATVELPPTASKVELPSELLNQLNDDRLEIKTDNLTLEFPSGLLKDLLGELPEGEKGTLALSFTPIGKAEAETALSGRNPGLTVQIAGQAYDFILVLQTEDGEETGISHFSQPITIRLKADPAADRRLTGIYYIANDGSMEYAGGSWTGGELTAQIDHFSMYAVLEVTPRFDDVEASFWAHDVIQELAAKQIMEGTAPGAFEPQRSITRAEFTALLARALGLQANGQMPFTDVPVDAWYAEAVAAVFEAGIVKGRSSESFDPNAAITRQEMAVMAMTAYSITNGTAAAVDITLPFKDMEEVDQWAIDSVRSAFELGLIKGRKSDLFVPQAWMSRAEAGQVIHRILNQ
ncbi:glycosyl hydrolase 53 family protein [Paenibacillus abyssi]|uniref:Arabinogalactan endo-beta-1,4-galactanase n=1 Tax=Paenibacillus abyssi TaxID=1340531 RepID=A0A917G4J0_9BACL|nr:glycosyl hydrolase 53 family protein [Paenibacillus abyssi]GGG22745.1 hypothetical protein GCM10010916_44270 [Paenibacillus abyssi]